MRNILFYYSSQQVHTGSPKVLMRLIEGLDQAVHKPFFLAGHEGELCRELIKKGAVPVWGETGQIAKSAFIRNMTNIFRLIRLLRKYRIELVHMNELGWNSELSLAAWLMGIPIIHHIHNPEKLSRKNLNCYLGTKFLFVSRALADQCNAGTILGSKAEIVYNPITVEKFAKGRSIRRELGVPDNSPVVGSVAQICRRKGIDIIIETAAQLKRIKPEVWFLVVGPDALGEEEFASQMRKRVLDLGLGDQFKFCGPMDDVENFLASIDVFFLPTRSEPFGMVIAEAMAAGVPVVSSKVGGIPEIIPDDSCGLLSDAGSCNFHHEIVRLLEDPEKTQSIEQKGYERVNSMFSHEFFNARIGCLYETVAHAGTDLESVH